jgi:hypothetical protein
LLFVCAYEDKFTAKVKRTNKKMVFNNLIN